MTTQQTHIVHGGDLVSASIRYNIPESDWVDLSTGLNPITYPCDDIPATVFSRLPYPSPEFRKTVEGYYGPHAYRSLAGTQEIIQQLPLLLADLPVILPSLGYQEHQCAWTNKGAEISFYDACILSKADAMIKRLIEANSQQHLLIINPNNPSGLMIPLESLFSWAAMLGTDAMLIVDEAFIDLTPEASLLSRPPLPDNILVLRSCGKFFGLGGIRAGFIFGSPKSLSRIQFPSNPWPLNGPAMHILSKALPDRYWQHASRKRIQTSAQEIQSLFAPLVHNKALKLLADRGLFISFQGSPSYLSELYEFFAKAGILLRLISVNNDFAMLRVGLVDHLDKTSIERIRQCVAQVASKNAFDSFIKTRPRRSISERNK